MYLHMNPQKRKRKPPTLLSLSWCADTHLSFSGENHVPSAFTRTIALVAIVLVLHQLPSPLRSLHSLHRPRLQKERASHIQGSITTGTLYSSHSYFFFFLYNTAGLGRPKQEWFVCISMMKTRFKQKKKYKLRARGNKQWTIEENTREQERTNQCIFQTYGT